jgi:hypothetical protein
MGGDDFTQRLLSTDRLAPVCGQVGTDASGEAGKGEAGVLDAYCPIRFENGVLLQ